MKLKDKYTWHLRALFKGKFDQSHWWNEENKSVVSPIAAVYELARRHPRIGDLRTRLNQAKWHGMELRGSLSLVAQQKMYDLVHNDLGNEPSAVRCLCLIGLSSWPTLSERDRDFWMQSVGKMKGVDCRDDLERCTSITSKVLSQLYLNRAIALKPDRDALKFRVSGSGQGGKAVVQAVNLDAFGKLHKRLAISLEQNPISKEEIEGAIAVQAIEAYRAGDWLFTVVPDLTSVEASELLAKTYAEEQKLSRLPKQRARWSDWLPLIAAFENDELMGEKVKSTVFTKYRRIMESITFT